MTRPDQESVDCYQKEHGVLETHTKTQVRTRHDLSLVYTPGVAEICRRIRDGRESAFTCTMKANTVAIVTDGSAILGMGDLGPYPAIPVMEGKALLYREFAGIDAIPICLDAGQTPLPRLISRIAPVFGAIDLEDIAAPRCFALEDELRDLGIPVLHSDQHATAVVVLAALINACRVTGKRFADLQVVIAGAGASGTAIARLLKCVGMESDICSPVADLIVCDRKGIIHRGRPDTFDTPHRYLLAHETNSENRQGGLEDATGRRRRVHRGGRSGDRHGGDGPVHGQGPDCLRPGKPRTGDRTGRRHPGGRGDHRHR